MTDDRKKSKSTIRKGEEIASTISSIVKSRRIDSIFEDNVQLSYLPLSSIIVDENVREEVDTESESFLALVASIEKEDVIQPVLVYPKDGKYVLMVGQRRFVACQKLNFSSIPARIYTKPVTREHLVLIQLSENIHRENLNPIDEANAYLKYYRLANTKEDVTVENMYNDIVTFQNQANKLKSERTTIMDVIAKLSGKSITYLRRTISLLKLPKEIQEVVIEGKLSVTKGYVYVDNAKSPRLWDVFNKDKNTNFSTTVKSLEHAFKTQQKKRSAIGFYQRFTKLGNDLHKNIDLLSASQLDMILEKAKELIKNIELVRTKIEN